MNRIEVRGVIVPSSYDGQWADDYIKRGMMIPESRFRKMLTESDKKQPLEIYINSPGGSVFAGNEMINALNAWIKESTQEVTVTIGAMAASMAAVMSIAVNAAKVKAHKNSKIMFHGAWGETVGGAEAHADVAELLSKINNDAKAILVSRFKLSPETVEGWFAEGREGWLTAEDAKNAGIVSEIIDASDKPAKINKSASAMLSERGMKLAAILENDVVEVEEIKQEVKADESGSKGPEPEAKSGDTAKEVVATGAGTAGIEGVATGATAVPTQAVMQPPENVEALHDAIESLKAEIKNLHDTITAKEMGVVKTQGEARDWQARYDKAVAEAVKVKLEHDKALAEKDKIISERDSRIQGLGSRLSKYTLDALAFHPDSAITSWQGALQAFNGDYFAARRKHPELYDEYVKQERKQKNERMRK